MGASAATISRIRSAIRHSSSCVNGAWPRTSQKYPPTVDAECSMLTSAPGNTSAAAVMSRNESDRR